MGRRAITAADMLEPRRHHADDREQLATQANGAAHDGRVGVEPPPPNGIAENRNVRVLALLRPRERPAHHRSCAEHVEIGARDAKRAEALRPAVDRQLKVLSHVAGDTGQRAVLVTVGQQTVRPDRKEGKARVRFVDPHQPLWFRVRQRIEEHAAHEAEDGRGRPYSECQRQQRDTGEADVTAQTPGGLPNVLQQRVERGQAALIAVRLLYRVQPSEPQPCRAFCRRGRNPAPHLGFGLHRQVELEFPAQVAIVPRNPEGRAHAGHPLAW